MGVVFAQFLHLPIAGRDGAAAADLDTAWDDLAARLEKGPAFIAAGPEAGDPSGPAVGMVGPQQIAGVPDFFSGALSEAARGSWPAARRRWPLRGRPRRARSPRSRRPAPFSTPTSLPGRRTTPSARPLRTDAARELLLPFAAAEVEDMARDEFAHGWAEEAWLTALSRNRNLAFGPESGGGLAPGGPALRLLPRRIAELTPFMEEHEVVTVARLAGLDGDRRDAQFLQPVSPGAAMDSPGLSAKSTTGYYFITPPGRLRRRRSAST